MSPKTFTILEVDNVADIANKWWKKDLAFHGVGQPAHKITSEIVWQVLKAIGTETPICRNCESEQMMIFQDRGERSIYYCPNCKEEIDFEFWLNGMYAKDGLDAAERTANKNLQPSLPVVGNSN